MIKALVPSSSKSLFLLILHKLEVARCALDAGASIVNNIRGTQSSTGFLKMVRDYKACHCYHAYARAPRPPCSQ